MSALSKKPFKCSDSLWIKVSEESFVNSTNGSAKPFARTSYALLAFPNWILRSDFKLSVVYKAFLKSLEALWIEVSDESFINSTNESHKFCSRTSYEFMV